MANIISDVMKMATPAIIEKIASSFGMSAATVTAILSAAVPGLMGAVANRAATPSGAKDVLAALAGANPNLATGLVSALSGGNASSLATSGTGMLTSLLGQGGLSTLTSAITSGTGASPAAGASLMGVAGQLVMGQLAKQGAGLDAAGLMNLMTSQKGFIQAALPANLASVVGMASTAAAGVTAAAASAKAAAPKMPSVPAPQSGSMGWLKFAIPALVLAAGAWYFISNQQSMNAPTPAAEITVPAATATAPAATPGGIMVGDLDVTQSLGTAFTDLTTNLAGVTDVASANTALPKLLAAAASVTAVNDAAAKFTPEQKTAVAGLVNAGLPALTEAATKVEAIAGVGDIVKPVLDGVLAQLANLIK